VTKKILIVLAAIVALGSGFLYARGLMNVHQSLTPPAQLAALVLEKSPKPAPPVGFADAAAGHHTLAEFKGRYVLLNLWATWCAPCVSELPALARLQGAVPALKVVTVDTFDRDNVDTAGFLKSHHAGALPAYRDNEKVMMKNFGAYGLPISVLIDPKGNVIARTEGPAAWSDPAAVDYFKGVVGG
jgi:thiol-disulfide isomerase/thioredoxin